MPTIDVSPEGKPATAAKGQLPVPRPTVRGFLGWRNVWLIGALLVAAVAAFACYWTFGKAKVVYATPTVERGDTESTVVAAGVLQPILYVDVGAQTSGKLQSLKVKRGDQVTKGQLLAEIDPVLADSALTGPMRHSKTSPPNALRNRRNCRSLKPSGTAAINGRPKLRQRS